MNPVKALENHGQAVWLDFLARGFVAKGDLKKLIDTDGVKGVTSNPSIFEKAIGSSDEYDGAIGTGPEKGDRPVAELFEHLAVEDIQHAADVLRPVYDRLKGDDGFVSLEVSPYLAMDTKGTIAEAERLWKDVDRKNLMVKVPATPEGLPAIQHLIGEGISINITLLFSQKVYVQVAEAYLAGLEKYVAGGGDPSHVASVASFFVSRIDSAVDKQLDEKIARANDPTEKERLAALKGKVAIANAKLAYQDYKRLFSGARWDKLAAKGAKTAAAAVGLDRHQEQGLQRRALCRGADRPQHHQHRAAGDARRVPRSWQAARQPRGKYRGRAACARRARKIRHLARRDHRRTGQGRRQAVRRRRRQALRRGRAQARHRARRRYRPPGACARRAHRQGGRKGHRGLARLGEDPPALAARQIGLDRHRRGQVAGLAEQRRRGRYRRLRGFCAAREGTEFLRRRRARHGRIEPGAGSAGGNLCASRPASRNCTCWIRPIRRRCAAWQARSTSPTPCSSSPASPAAPPSRT